MSLTNIRERELYFKLFFIENNLVMRLLTYITLIADLPIEVKWEWVLIIVEIKEYIIYKILFEKAG